jgi:hypothetical protein
MIHMRVYEEENIDDIKKTRKKEKEKRERMILTWFDLIQQ